MKTYKFNKTLLKFLLIICLMFFTSKGFADDTCIFAVTADSVPPNIVLLLDNGAEMEHIIWHEKYDNSNDYTTMIDVHSDGLDNDGDGATDEADLTEEIQWPATTTNGFTHEQGYTIVDHGGKKYIVKILADLKPDTYDNGIKESLVSTFIINNRTITLPSDPSAAPDGDGIIDNATIFRYSRNYLNWIFFSTGPGSYIDVSSVDDGTDLPSKSRFYYAKKAIFTVAEVTQQKAKFGINAFTSTAAGSSNVQPLGFVYDAAGNVDPNFVNTINNLGTVYYSPLAEGLAAVAGYYASPSSGVVGEYCQKSFVIVITSGVSSEDQAVAAGSVPTVLSDYDNDYDTVNNVDVLEGEIKVDATTYNVPMNINGSSWLDDVAWYLFTHDIVGYQDGWQNVFTYTIGFMGNTASNAYLINTSNNGNGNLNLYDSTNKDYKKYHFEAEKPAGLAQVLIDAINAILSQTSTFNAPVVPVTRTTSGSDIYLSFFKPSNNNFWQGDVTKYALDDDNNIIDKNGNLATWPNGAFKDDAEPFWSAKAWADPASPNYMPYADRIIYTDANQYGDTLSGDDPQTDGFHTLNPRLNNPASFPLCDAYFGHPTNTRADIIDYIRGKDVFDQDEDTIIDENRKIILGDVLHSEPLVVFFRTTNASGTETITKRVFFGSNDGMFHAVDDETGKELWAFIPSDQIHKLKDIVEGISHQYFVDGSPKGVIVHTNAAGVWEIDQDGFVDYDKGDNLIMLCGERMGGTSYLYLRMWGPDQFYVLGRFISNKSHGQSGTLRVNTVSGTFVDGEVITGASSGQKAPVDGTLESGMYLDYIERQTSGVIFEPGETIKGATSGATATIETDTMHAPEFTKENIIDPELGESWSEPKFAIIHSDTFGGGGNFVSAIIGGGYSDDNSSGRSINIFEVFLYWKKIKGFSNINTTNMNYSIPSSVSALDEDYDTITDKIYVGDLGGQLWRIGSFDVDSVTGDPLSFPDTDQDVDTWTAKRLLVSDTSIPPDPRRNFYYAPTVTLEKKYDLVLTGSGDRDDPCNRHVDAKGTPDGFYDAIYAVKDNHQDFDLYDFNLVDVTNETTAPTPKLDNETADVDSNGYIDKGWFFYLSPGEKVLSESVVFAGILYATGFMPNNDVCLPGGAARLYGVDYKTGAGALGNSNVRNVDIGGGIPSRPVVVIKEPGDPILLISVGSTTPDDEDAPPEDESKSSGHGIKGVALPPGSKFNLLWWLEFFNN